jgi:hypothetical protein
MHAMEEHMDSISLDFRAGVELGDLQEAISRLVELRGCPGCGLNGFDLSMRLHPELQFGGLLKEIKALERITVQPAISQFQERGPRLG